MKLTYKIFFIFFIFCGFADAQSVDIVVRLNSSAPEELISSLRNNLKSDKFRLTKILTQFDATDTKPLFAENTLKKISSKDIGANGFDRIFRIKIDSKNLSSALKLLSTDKYVLYAEKINFIKLNNISTNDPYSAQQYYLNKINSPQSLEITKGDSTIIIGVIDSGLDFNHPDLTHSFKMNYNEIPDGIDNDGNGYIDDIKGWNFVDDNNNPQDNNIYSHGTSVTGVINATINNGIGISSIAPNCKVLVLKAFDANGMGGEDNIARAILYGIGQGVRIFNMSFGDVIYSSLLRDVLRYAYSKNIVLVASAGNTGNTVIQYPSAFDEVISVGASDAYDYKTSFSSYGETVDIFAPGNQIFTTSDTGKGSVDFEKNYFYVNGTSFSSPIIAASAALLLSLNKNLTNEEVRGILTYSCDYMQGQYEWNSVFASGRVNLLNALLNYKNPSAVKFNFPYQDFTTHSDTLPICVTATSTFFSSYSIVIKDLSGRISDRTLISHSPSQALNDTVAYIDISQYPDTALNLHITLYTSTGKTIENGIIIHKDTKSPVIASDYSNADILVGNRTSHLVAFSTDKPTIGKIFYRKKNSGDIYKFIYADLGYENIGYVSQYHFGIIDESDLPADTQYEFYIEAEGLNGKISDMTDANFLFTTQQPVTTNGYIQKSYTLPAVQFADTVVDVFGNGGKDIFVNLIDSNLQLAAYEFSGNAFHKISHNEWGNLMIARNLGSVNQPGTLDMVANKSRTGFIFEQASPGTLPIRQIWSSSDFWVSDIYDIDKDGLKEVFGFYQDGLKIYHFNNGNATLAATLPNSSADAESNSESLLIGSFNSQMSEFVIFSDLQFSSLQIPTTHLNLYYHGNDYIFTQYDSYPISGEMLIGECLAAADIDNDGYKEICLLTSSGNSGLLSYYALHIFKIVNNKFAEMQPVYFYNTAASSSSISALSGAKDFLYVNIGNNLYVLSYDSQSSSLKPEYYRNDINSFNKLSYDFDGNGIAETGLATTDNSTIFIEKITNPQSPLPPAAITSYGDDSDKVVLNFSAVNGASYYRIYRAQNDTTYTLLDSTTATQYIDTKVKNSSTYYYKISTIDNSYPIHESILSGKTKSFVHNKIKLTSANPDGTKNLVVTFSGSVSHLTPSPADFIIQGLPLPASVSYKSDRQYILNYENKLPDGNYSLKTKSLKDLYNSPIDSNLINFSITNSDTAKLFIRNAQFISGTTVKVEFSINVDSASAMLLTNYSIEPDYLRVINATTDKNILYLEIGGKGKIGATGINYILRIKNLLSQSGIKIVDGAGSTYAFNFVKETLDDVTVFPNPYIRSTAKGYLTFANLTKQASVYIFDISGRFINKLESTETFGGIRWDMKDSNGNDVPTGIYIYRVTGKDSSGKDVEDKVNKFAVIK